MFFMMGHILFMLHYKGMMCKSPDAGLGVIFLSFVLMVFFLLYLVTTFVASNYGSIRAQ